MADINMEELAPFIYFNFFTSKINNDGHVIRRYRVAVHGYTQTTVCRGLKRRGKMFRFRIRAGIFFFFI